MFNFTTEINLNNLLACLCNFQERLIIIHTYFSYIRVQTQHDLRVVATNMIMSGLYANLLVRMPDKTDFNPLVSCLSALPSWNNFRHSHIYFVVFCWWNYCISQTKQPEDLMCFSIPKIVMEHNYFTRESKYWLVGIQQFLHTVRVNLYIQTCTGVYFNDCVSMPCVLQQYIC